MHRVRRLRHLLIAAALVTVVALGVPVGAATATAATVQTQMVATPAPWISRTAPTIGSTTGGDRVTIAGHHFTGTISVRFGGVPGTNLVVASGTRIMVTTPAHVIGRFRVRVTAPGRSSVRGVTYEFVSPPTVTSVSPSSGPIAGGTTVTVTGTHLGDACCVRFGGTVATDLVVVNDTMLTVTAPAHGPGDVRVRVVGPDTSTAPSSSARFTYVGPPTVTGISPSSGRTTGGNAVTITGTGFAGTTSVAFGSTAASSYTVDSDTQITAVSPAGPVAVVDVTVTTGAGTSSTSSADEYSYVPQPTITNLTPTSGPAAGGTTVTITGTGFTGVTSVEFAATTAPFTVVNDTTLTVVTPAESPGSVDVLVFSPGGSAEVVQGFTYI